MYTNTPQFFGGTRPEREPTPRVRVAALMEPYSRVNILLLGACLVRRVQWVHQTLPQRHEITRVVGFCTSSKCTSR
jgi:hypothetical protein